MGGVGVQDELLPVVDARDEVIELRPRPEVHAKGLMHRAVHVLVFDGQGRLYLQRRSQSKDTHPGKWTSSASGHVDPGEGYFAAARRELLEELGLSLEIAEAARLIAQPDTENEFVRVYTARTMEEPRPEPSEIAEGRWFAVGEAMELAADLGVSAPSLGAVLRAWQAAQGGKHGGADRK